MTDDADLLRRYADEEAEDAFAELVRRHIDFVYTAALRQTSGNTALAQDVTQMVFIDLARKAARLSRHTALVGWLHTATRFAAGRLMRGEVRRKERERIAESITEPDPAATVDWTRVQPVLDDVLGELKERERTALLLRFFEGKRLADVGVSLALTEDAARSCIDRALDKVRDRLARRGITSSSAALGAAFAQHTSVAAPLGLATTVTTSALAGVSASGGLLFAAGTLLTMGKIKVGIVSALALTGLVTAIVEVRANRTLTAEARSLGTEDVERLQRENRRLAAEVGKLSAGNADLEELNRLRARAAMLRARPAGVVEAEIRAPRNLGRATPAAAIETFGWAVDNGDLDMAASFLTFSDDTPENREALLAQFSPAIRARYRTVERLWAAAFFGVGFQGRTERTVGMQVISVEERPPDQARMKLWFRTSTGREVEGGTTYVQRADGWAEKPVSLLVKPEVLAAIKSRLDPVTGDFIPPKNAPAGK